MPKQWADLRLQARELSIYKVSVALAFPINEAHGDCPRCSQQSQQSQQSLKGTLSLWDCEGRFRCWSCHQSGDSLELVQFVLGCNATAAWNWLKSHGFLQDPKSPRFSARPTLVPKHSTSYPVSALDLACRVLQKSLPPLSAAMEAWLFKRGVNRAAIDQMGLRSAFHPAKLYEILGESLNSEELKQLGMDAFGHHGLACPTSMTPLWSEGRALVLPLLEGGEWKSFEIWYVQGTHIHLWQHAVIQPFFWEYSPQKAQENRIWLVGSFADALVYIKRQLPVGIRDRQGNEQDLKAWIQERTIYLQASDWRLSEEFFHQLKTQLTSAKLSFHLES